MGLKYLLGHVKRTRQLLRASLLGQSFNGELNRRSRPHRLRNQYEVVANTVRWL